MNPNKNKFINTLKTGLNTLNTASSAFGGNPVVSLPKIGTSILNKAPSLNPSATSPAKTNYINQQKSNYQGAFGASGIPTRPVTTPASSSTGTNSVIKPPALPSVGTAPVAPQLSELDKAQKAVDDFNASKNRGLEGINQKVIPLEFQTGQKSALERDTALTGTELQTQLARLQGKEEADRQAKQQEFENQLALKKFALDSSKSGTGANDLLSISEAKALGVPYGTSRADAIGKRSLNAGQLEAQNNANSALLSLKNLTSLIQNPEGGYNSGRLVNLGLGRVGQSERELRDVITRIRTGAALSANEESFYKKQIPRAVDDDATIQQKVNQLAAFYSGISGSPVTLELPDGEILIADDMFDPETRNDVKTAIGNGANVISY